MPLAGPAPASLFDGWLSTFMGYVVTNWGLRVDYLPAHEYPGNNSGASSGIWINTLQSAYNTWGKPVWMTEFGCVDWAGNQSWTEENNYNALAEFLWRAESLPWLRKYAIFSFGGPLAPNPWTPTTPAPAAAENGPAAVIATSPPPAAASASASVSSLAVKTESVSLSRPASSGAATPASVRPGPSLSAQAPPWWA